ncbi:MAG: ribose-phosphate diphosphokinase [Candidatus Helarchaeota archaeon]
MIVVPGPASQDLATEIAHLLPSGKIAPITSKEFPDGELYIRIDMKLKSETVIIVQSTYAPQDRHLMQLYQLIDAARNSEANKVIVFVPYLAYSRQDKKFLDGEPLSSRIVCKTIEHLGADEIFVLDIHSKIILDFFTIPIHNLLALDLFLEYFKQIPLSHPMIVAPDEGALEKAQIVAQSLNCGCTHICKMRDRHTGAITVTLKDMNVRDRDLIILDDIISTGGTMAKAIKMAKTQGANKIYAVCSHPLLIQNAEARIFDAGATDIIGTNSIDSKYAKISIAPLFVKEFMK